MRLPDVNVLVYAHRPESPEHDAYKEWLTALVRSPEAFALSEIVMQGFVRVVTNPRVFKDPTPVRTAFEFLRHIMECPTARSIRPGARHFDIFTDLCEATKAAGPIVADAYHAALAIEQGCEWITTDGDFARFRGLRFSHPLRG